MFWCSSYREWLFACLYLWTHASGHKFFGTVNFRTIFAIRGWYTWIYLHKVQRKGHLGLSHTLTNGWNVAKQLLMFKSLFHWNFSPVCDVSIVGYLSCYFVTNQAWTLGSCLPRAAKFYLGELGMGNEDAHRKQEIFVLCVIGEYLGSSSNGCQKLP